MKFRNVRVKMKGGKSRIQRAMVLASGKLRFVKNVTRSRSSRKAGHTHIGGKRRNMARKKGHHSNRKMTIPIAPVVGLLAGIAPSIPYFMDGNWKYGVNELAYSYVGIESATDAPHWNSAGLDRGLKPLILGMLIHKFIGGAPLNVNRTLAAAKVPLLRI